MATKYWVGNGGNWSDTAHWSTSSGGGGGAAVPTKTDAVIFDGSSFTAGGQVVTINTGAVRYSAGIDCSAVTNTPELKFSTTVYVFDGDVTFSASMTISGSAGISFCHEACNYYSNGQTIGTLVVVYDTAKGATVLPTLDLHDDVAVTGTFAAAGNLNTNGYDITCNIFKVSSGYSGDPAVTVSLGDSVISCAQSFRAYTYPNLAVSAGTSTIKIGYYIDTSDYGGDAQTYYNIEFDQTLSPSTTMAEMLLDEQLVCTNLTVNAGYETLACSSYWPYHDPVIKVLGEVSVNGSAAQQLTWRNGDMLGEIVRLFKDSGTVNLNYVTLKGVCASGSTPTGAISICTGGTASALLTVSGYSPDSAFDGDFGTDWEGDGVPNWIQYDLGSGVIKAADRYSVRSYDNESYCISSWTFEGSNDGSSWTTLDTQSFASPNGVFEIENTTTYRYYRWSITVGGLSYPDVLELEIFESAEYSDGADFYALLTDNCVDGGGNAGWLFESAPPEPVFAAPIGQYNEGDHMAYAPGDSGGTAVWREAGTSSTPITDIHRPGCGYWFKETGTVYGGEVGPWVPWNVDQKVEFNEGSSITKSPSVSGGSPIWKVGETGPAITDTHVPCGYWFKDYDSDSQLRRICLGLEMGYTKTDMVVDEQQTFYVKDSNGDTVACPITVWTLSGVGSLSESVGPTTVYTAPSYSGSGADSATITLWCGGAVKDTLVISVAHSCDCLDTIGYTSLQMSVSGSQTLTASGAQDDDCYAWAITSGGGSLSAATGKSVVYTAPSSNANCSSNPTISLSCGGSVVSTITIAVNANATTDYAYGIKSGYTCGDPYSNGDYWCINVSVYTNQYKCDGTLKPAGSWICTNIKSTGGACCRKPCTITCADADAAISYPFGVCDNLTFALPASGGMVDLRTAAMITAGCCPAALI